MDAISQRNNSVEDKVAPFWIRKGLRFHCTGCGGCCGGAPGYVFLGLQDLKRLAEHHSLPLKTFLERYARRVDKRWALIDRPGTYDCIFLKNKSCSVYSARPTQCRTFPWWIDQIQDPKSWQEAKERCEGIDHPEAPLVPIETIEKEARSYLENILDQNFTSIS
ncbi:MAG: YkgJ family cysteine cluster protein [Verrucomicrobiota bacterium]|nr:YkgJ family cysteine cluster protein [Verrucomicrobiota bacterium]